MCGEEESRRRGTGGVLRKRDGGRKGGGIGDTSLPFSLLPFPSPHAFLSFFFVVAVSLSPSITNEQLIPTLDGTWYYATHFQDVVLLTRSVLSAAWSEG